MIDELMKKYKDKEMSKDILCQIRKDISDYFSNLYEKTFDFNSYKFDISATPSECKITINPGDLATALLLYNGTLINQEITEYEDEENYYIFTNGKFIIKHKQKLEYITVTNKVEL